MRQLSLPRLAALRRAAVGLPGTVAGLVIVVLIAVGGEQEVHALARQAIHRRTPAVPVVGGHAAAYAGTDGLALAQKLAAILGCHADGAGQRPRPGAGGGGAPVDLHALDQFGVDQQARLVVKGPAALRRAVQRGVEHRILNAPDVELLRNGRAAADRDGRLVTQHLAQAAGCAGLHVFAGDGSGDIGDELAAHINGLQVLLLRQGKRCREKARQGQEQGMEMMVF